MATLPYITDEMLSTLRDTLQKQMSEKRFLHTLGVEKEIVRLGELYLPNDLLRLRAAALLHDITKEYSINEQFSLCEHYHIPITSTDRLSPKIFHARTAVYIIRERFSAFADPVIIKAIEQHTTGARSMSLFSKLLYVADYIEETRTFPDCISLRAAFWDPISTLASSERIAHLNRILLRSYYMTIAALLAEDAVISPATIDARNALIEEFSTYNP